MSDTYIRCDYQDCVLEATQKIKHGRSLLLLCDEHARKIQSLNNGS